MRIEGEAMSSIRTINVDPIINTAPSLGGLNRFGVELKAPISSSVIEGSVGASFLKNTVFLTPGFQPELDSAEVLAEADSILALSKPKPAPDHVPTVFENSLIDINLDPTIPISPDIHLFEAHHQPYRERVLQQVALAIVLAHTLLPIHPEGEEAHINHITGPKIAIERVVKPQIYLEPVLHSEPISLAALAHPIEAIEYKEETEGEEKEGKIGFHEQEHIETTINPAPNVVIPSQLVEDTEKIIKREEELDQAIEQVFIETEGQVEGWRIIKQIPAQHKGVRSQTLNAEDPQNTLLDGSYEKVKEEVKKRKFKSKIEAKNVAFVLNKKYRAEKWGKTSDITLEEHQRIHEQHNHERKITDYPDLAQALKIA